MKKEKYIYLTAFLFGVIGTNILVSKEWINPACLRHHELLQLAYSQINYENYLVELLLLRFKTMGILWLLGKVIPTKLVRHLTGGMLCMALGNVLTCSILANGVWGILLLGGILFPQWIFYIGAYKLWGSFSYINSIRNDRKKNVIEGIVLVIVVMLGCISEAYLNPVILQLIVNY